jgi:hypothetical protein
MLRRAPPLPPPPATASTGGEHGERPRRAASMSTARAVPGSAPRPPPPSCTLRAAPPCRPCAATCTATPLPAGSSAGARARGRARCLAGRGEGRARGRMPRHGRRRSRRVPLQSSEPRWPTARARCRHGHRARRMLPPHPSTRALCRGGAGRARAAGAAARKPASECHPPMARRSASCRCWGHGASKHSAVTRPWRPTRGGCSCARVMHGLATRGDDDDAALSSTRTRVPMRPMPECRSG